MGAMQSWSTNPLPDELRFSAWSEKMQSLHLEWMLSTPAEDRYSAEIRYRTGGGSQIADCSCTSFSGRHEPGSDTADLVGVQLHVSGHMKCSYGSDSFTLAPGDIFVWSGDSVGSFESVGQHRQLTFIVPRARVPGALDEWLERSHRVHAGPGTGLISVAADSIRGIAREMEFLTDGGIDHAVTGLLELLGAAIGPVRDEIPSRRAALVADVQKFVLTRLEDPSMSMHSIATALSVSTRTLHAAFAEENITLGRWIRLQRLERCRRELASAARDTTVTSVAFRWGFSDAAHFSRSFKETFGISPSAVMPRARTAD